MPQSHSVLWLSNNFIYICATSLFIPLFMDSLGCFHVPAVVNSATVNIGVHVFFEGLFLKLRNVHFRTEYRSQITFITVMIFRNIILLVA